MVVAMEQRRSINGIFGPSAIPSVGEVFDDAAEEGNEVGTPDVTAHQEQDSTDEDENGESHEQIPQGDFRQEIEQEEQRNKKEGRQQCQGGALQQRPAAPALAYFRYQGAYSVVRYRHFFAVF